MASMIKEKRRAKKKTKEKLPTTCLPVEGEFISIDVAEREDTTVKPILENVIENAAEMGAISRDVEQSADSREILKQKADENEAHLPPTEDAGCSKDFTTNISQETSTGEDSYKNLNARLKRMAIPEPSSKIDDLALLDLENIDAYLQSKQNQILKESLSTPEFTLEVIPSAPMFLEQTESQASLGEDMIQEEKPKMKCMLLDEAIRLCGGTEMAIVKDMSVREEAEVEAGPNCAPEHPLIDLLSTFRSSIRAVERERSRLASNFDDEEKFRSTLWKIEKQKMHLTEQCKCGVSVDMKVTYDYAQLMKEKLPAAKLKLEGLLKDVQESFCHHQHAALLAHCQIEDLVSETIQGPKNGIRETLSLILQSLRVSDGASEVLPAALQRWAEILASALVDARDLRQLFFVMHHLFRQTRSVRWAARVLYMRVGDGASAARALAVLDTLLCKLHLESAVECLEELEEAWEEVDVRGGHGAVSSGTLRERDLIALVRALPLQQLVAKLVLFSQSDFRQATEYDWGDASGGSGILKSCCGVRVLLSILQRAVAAHGTYARLHAVLRELAGSALTALACLYWTPRAPYLQELEEKITAELHATFAAGFALFGTQDLHKLPTLLLSEHAANDYCLSFIAALHEKSRKTIESLCIDAPVLPCGTRVRIIAHAAADREQDHELARIVLDFLLQTGVVRKSMACKAGCEPTARECIPLLLTAHPYLRGLALHTVADMSQVETLDPSIVSVLQVNKWRPDVDEMRAVLDDWSQRCPTLLQQMLLQLDYTPHTGVSLAVQLHIGSWLCAWGGGGAWRVLLRLRTHRAAWGAPAAAPPPAPPPADPLSMAHAVLASEWGHSLPLICTQGVNAILTICATRPREAVHCLAPIMLLMPQSPESVSLTPKFAELFTILLSCGPNLVQRALGRGGVSGSELLLRLVLSQVEMKEPYVFTAWLHALWKVPAALSILDIAALAVRDWFELDQYAATLVREENAKEHLTNAVRFAFTSPLLCECLLRAAHTHEVHARLFPALLAALCAQRAAAQRTHVHNALQKINPHMSSEELVIYRCANAALVAPFQHPSHLTLWRLFFHIYLEKPHDQFSPTPCGPLFFSGIIKSRTLSQIKKRLLETATYHHSEAISYKKETNESNQPRNRMPRSESIAIDNYQSLLPALTITDLTGEARVDSDDSDSEDRGSVNMAVDGSTEEAIEVERKRNANMAAYHTGAEKMMRDYSRWLEEGEKVQALPQHADIARYLPPQALEEAWKNTLSRCRPPPSPELDTFIRPEPAPPYNTDVPKTPLQTAVATILSIKCRSPVSESYRSLRTIRPRVDEMDDTTFKDIRQILARVDELLKDIEKHAEEWNNEVVRISCQDSKLWELVSALRVARPLPPMKKQCINNCKPITFYLNTQEWCISAGAERGIRECRSAALAGIRRLTRARPHVVRAAASLHNIARRTRSADHAVQVLELAWRCAGHCKACGAAHAALTTLFDTLAERWITHDGKLCNKLLFKGCQYNSSTLQHTLCGSLVSPRSMKDSDWPDIYVTLLQCSLPPHTIFSFLSRFEMSRWTVKADSNQRIRILEALLLAAQRPPGPDPESEAVLLELVGVHTAAVATSAELVRLLLDASGISRRGDLPVCFWRHLLEAVDQHASGNTLDDLNTILHNMGIAWRSVSTDFCERHATYAHVLAELFCIVVREFVGAALRLTFEPLRVCSIVWPAMLAAWSPWVQPASILPQPACSDHYVTMLKRFTSCIRQIMRDCPGLESKLLQDVYEWAITTCKCVGGTPRAQQQALLEQLARLPWRELQWFQPRASVCTLRVLENRDDVELMRWCCERFVGTKVETLLVGVEQAGFNMFTYISHLLKLFVGFEYVNDPELLNEATKLPWFEIDVADLTEGWKYFLNGHYKSSKPLHEIPQAMVIIYAAELQPPLRQRPSLPHYSSRSRSKRASLVTEWSSVYREPAMLAQSAGYTQFMLDILTSMEPHLENNFEFEELLFHLSCILQWEKTEATPAVQAVWLKWVLNAPRNLIPSIVHVACRMRVVEVTGPISDNATRLYLQLHDGGWGELCRLWRFLVLHPWMFVEPRALYAAYAATIAYSGSPPVRSNTLLTKLEALIESNGIDYIKYEGIVAVWICYMVRIVHDCNAEIAEATKATNATSTDATEATEATSATEATKAASATNIVTTPKLTMSELEDCKQAALSVLAAWGQQQRRSILKVVTLQADTERPTARHRALIRFADCIHTPSTEAVKAYESAISALSGSNYSDVIAWGRTATPRRLTQLAVRLLPHVRDLYFQYEMDQWPSE